jgi:hypothetical protein
MRIDARAGRGRDLRDCVSSLKFAADNEEERRVLAELFRRVYKGKMVNRLKELLRGKKKPKPKPKKVTKKKREYVWRASCTGRDRRRGCFDADFEGVCTYKSRGCKTKKGAEVAAERHERSCKFRGYVHVSRELKK